MNILIGTILIGGAALVLFFRLPNAEWRRCSLMATRNMLTFTVPRVLVALLGAGFFAELLPADEIRNVFGDGAGLWGVSLAIFLGPITPGGAFVSFAIAAAGLKAGASMTAALGYVTSWSLFSLTKILAYELPLMGRSVLLTRLAVSLPVPFVVAFMARAVL